MRAVKSVIVAAGNLKRAYPDENEDVLLLRGLRDINVPKFLSQDLPLFAGIITDLFPGVEPPEIVYDDLLGAIAKCCKDMCAQPVETFTAKVRSSPFHSYCFPLFSAFFFLCTCGFASFWVPSTWGAFPFSYVVCVYMNCLLLGTNFY
jgi:hypothetical protein